MRRRLLIACLLANTGTACAQSDNWTHHGRDGEVTLAVGVLPQKWRAAFYINRGFKPAVIQLYASACGLSFGMRNTGGGSIESHLRDWRAIGADGAEVALRMPESWDAEWERAGVPQAARIAFHWAQFQSEIHFAAGDWIMGMATLSAAPQAPFKLRARYRDGGGEHEILIEGLACARE